MRLETDELVRLGLAALGADSEERDIARWGFCNSVCENLDDYRPGDPVQRPVLLRTYNGITLVDAVATDEAVARIFGAFRAQVTDVEAMDARKLSVVATVKLDLEDLRLRAAAPDSINHVLQRLAFFVRGAWRLEIPAERTAIRLWATRATRRYDVLPREWREL